MALSADTSGLLGRADDAPSVNSTTGASLSITGNVALGDVGREEDEALSDDAGTARRRIFCCSALVRSLMTGSGRGGRGDAILLACQAKYRLALSQ